MSKIMKIVASIFLGIMSVLYLFDITLFQDSRVMQIVVGLLMLVSIFIVWKKDN